MKVFLSHSSHEKPFVEKVAQRLGRANVRYDKYFFKTGDELREGLRKALGESGVFCLFVSRAALKSIWVRFEISEAEKLQIRGKLSPMVFFTEPGLRPDDLPDWLRDFHASSGPSSAIVARQIQVGLCSHGAIQSKRLFLGREGLLAGFSDSLLPVGGTVPPRFFAFTGLPGVGRRSFAENAVKNFLSLALASPIPIYHGQDIKDLFLRLYSDLSDSLTLDSLSEAKRGFDAAKYEDQVQEVARLLSQYSAYNLAPVLIDMGGVMEEVGGYQQYLWDILAQLSQYPSPHIVIVQSRRLPYELVQSKKLPFIEKRVPPLSLDASKLLFRQRCTQLGVAISVDQIDQIAPYIDGYPPAANWAADLCERYGVETFLADKSILVELKVRAFTPLLERISLREASWNILKILAAQISLPLDILALVLGADLVDVAVDIQKLIDLNFVETIGASVTISKPLREAVQRKQGGLYQEDYSRIAEVLGSKYWGKGDVPADAEIVEATVHAYARSGRDIPPIFKDVVLPSTLQRSAKQAYDAKEWRLSLRLAKQTLLLSPKDAYTRALLFKALVRIREYNQAEDELKRIEDLNYRGRHYLRGFLHWKMREYEEAVVAFRKALDSGDRGVHVYRDLSDCLHRLGRTPEAVTYLNMAIDRFRPNKYVLDLAICIAVECDDISTAESLLGDLKRVEEPEGYSFRNASVLAARGSFNAAFDEIKRAREAGSRRHEILGLEANILIELGQFPEAKVLLDIIGQDQDFDKDVLNGLNCKLCLRQGKWIDAEDWWGKISDKNRTVHRKLRARVLAMKIADMSVGLVEREAAKKELTEVGEIYGQTVWARGSTEEEEMGGDEEESS